MRFRRAISKILLAGTTVAVVAIVAGAVFQRFQEYRFARRFPPPGDLFSVGSYSLHMVCRGSGSPTVIIAPGGYGGSTTYAAELTDLVSEHVRVCAYDPPGQGWSEEGSDPGAISERFRAFAALLEQADVETPLLLVGESAGAHVVRLATDDPDINVAGLVLIDPAFDDLERERSHWSPAERRRAARLRRLAPVIPILAEVGLHRVLLRAPLEAATTGLPEEVRDLTTQQLLSRKAVRVLVDRSLERADGLPEVREANIPADIPLVVLTARPDGETAYQAEKEAYHRELADQSTRGQHYVIDGAQHAMIGDRPERVAEVIAAVIEDMRAVHQALGTDSLHLTR
jgi:pimeloyl-ACP methyl ester carboxylesterase